MNTYIYTCLRISKLCGGALAASAVSPTKATSGIVHMPNRDCDLAFTRYCHHQYCMMYGIKKRGRWGGRILRNGRAMVLQ